MNNLKLFRKNDLLVLIVISAVCIIMLLAHLFNQENLVASISLNGEEIEAIALSEVDGSYEIKPECSPALTIRVEKNKIRIQNAQCHDKLCVNCGWLDSNGDMAVCLPARVVVEIKGGNQKDLPDAITY